MSTLFIDVESREAIRKIINGRNVTVRQLSGLIDTAEQSVSKMLSGTRTLTDRSIAKIATALNVPFEVLKSGEGIEPYLQNGSVQNEAAPIGMVDETEVTVSKSGMEFRDLDNGMVLMTIPLVDEFAYASYPHGWKDPEYIFELPRYPIVLPKREKGIFRAFEVRGDSMDDNSRYSIGHGDVAIGRLIDSDYWSTKLHTNGGTDYVIATHDGVIVKRITQHDTKTGIITCASTNPDKQEYPDFEINLSEVYELYKVRKVDRDWSRR